MPRIRPGAGLGVLLRPTEGRNDTGVGREGVVGRVAANAVRAPSAVLPRHGDSPGDWIQEPAHRGLAAVSAQRPSAATRRVAVELGGVSLFWTQAGTAYAGRATPRRPIRMPKEPWAILDCARKDACLLAARVRSSLGRDQQELWLATVAKRYRGPAANNAVVRRQRTIAHMAGGEPAWGSMPCGAPSFVYNKPLPSLGSGHELWAGSFEPGCAAEAPMRTLIDD